MQNKTETKFLSVLLKKLVLKNVASIKEHMDFLDWTPELGWASCSYRACWAGAGFPSREEVPGEAHSPPSNVPSLVLLFSTEGRRKAEPRQQSPPKSPTHRLERGGRPGWMSLELPPHWRRPRDGGPPSPTHREFCWPPDRSLGWPKLVSGSPPIAGDFSPFYLPSYLVLTLHHHFSSLSTQSTQ